MCQTVGVCGGGKSSALVGLITEMEELVASLSDSLEDSDSSFFCTLASRSCSMALNHNSNLVILTDFHPSSRWIDSNVVWSQSGFHREN